MELESIVFQDTGLEPKGAKFPKPPKSSTISVEVGVSRNTKKIDKCDTRCFSANKWYVGGAKDCRAVRPFGASSGFPALGIGKCLKSFMVSCEADHSDGFWPHGQDDVGP